MSGRDHWEAIYSQKAEPDLSWHQDEPSLSLDLMRCAGLAPETSVIDIGAGTSRLVDSLLDCGLQDLAVLDVSAEALAKTRARLAEKAEKIEWIVADITGWQPARRYSIWHDRAVFHFLTDQKDRDLYVERLMQGLAPGGHAIMATFAPDGPEKCSGLPVARYNAGSLAAALGAGLSLMAERKHLHHTPWGRSQGFQYCLFRKTC